MTFKMLSAVLTACALIWSQAALANVTYSYTGNKFNQAYATVPGPQDSNADAWIWQLTQELRQQQLDFKFNTPVALPTGWSSFDQAGIYGELAASLQGNSQNSVSWNLIHPELGMSGTSTLGNTTPLPASTNGGFFVSLHVDTTHTIDAWEISYQFYDDFRQPTWAMFSTESLSISSATGDSVSFSFRDWSYFISRDAYNRTPGVWSVVPEPATRAMLLAGLGALLLLRRRAA